RLLKWKLIKLLSVTFSLRMTILFFIFFFSSRRRHTRCYRDWSSDVCSSDLLDIPFTVTMNGISKAGAPIGRVTKVVLPDGQELRSEERRVGKECRSRWGANP